MNFKEMIQSEDLNPDYFAVEAEALAKEMKGRADPRYILEKIRHIEGLKEIYCISSEGRGNTSKINACVAKLSAFK